MSPALGTVLPFPHLPPRWSCSSAGWCRGWHPSRPGGAGWAGQRRAPWSLVLRPALCVWTISATSRLVPRAKVSWGYDACPASDTPGKRPHRPSSCPTRALGSRMGWAEGGAAGHRGSSSQLR